MAPPPPVRRRTFLAIGLLGFASGLPFLLSGRTLQAWLTTAGVDLKIIGLLSLVGLPYSLKFLWSPVLDRVVPPLLGRRRGWLLITQLALLVTIALFALEDPRRSLRLLAVHAFGLAFLSATQDIAFDAYRIDALATRDLGWGAGVGVFAYRVALLVTGSLAFVLADRLSWPTVYFLLALLMLVGVAGTLLAPEPVLESGPPRTFADAVIQPFADFFRRTGLLVGMALLAFIVLYRLPDGLAGAMATPFLLQLGFRQTDVGLLQGGVGLASTLIGALLGGWIVARLGINRSLWIFALLQAGTNLLYLVLARAGPDRALLAATMVVENLAAGMVSAAFVAFLMSLCRKEYSATQYALLSSLLGVSRDLLAAPTGALAKQLGWPRFFLFTVAAVVPALALLPWLAPWGAKVPRGAAPHPGTVEASV